jgi:hypothetical protein
VFTAWRQGRALATRRKSPAALFRRAAVDLCRNLRGTSRVLLGNVVKLVQGLTRTVARIRRDIEDIFGTKLTWAEIEDLKRQAQLDRVERAIAEQRQFFEEWQATERQRLEEESALEEERVRAIRLAQDTSPGASTPPGCPTRSLTRGWHISAHHRIRRVH